MTARYVLVKDDGAIYSACAETDAEAADMLKKYVKESAQTVAAWDRPNGTLKVMRDTSAPQGITAEYDPAADHIALSIEGTDYILSIKAAEDLDRDIRKAIKEGRIQ